MLVVDDSFLAGGVLDFVFDLGGKKKGLIFKLFRHWSRTRNLLIMIFFKFRIRGNFAGTVV